MSIINFSLLGRKILPSDMEKKEDSTKNIDNSDLKKITSFDDVLKAKEEELKAVYQDKDIAVEETKTEEKAPEKVVVEELAVENSKIAKTPSLENLSASRINSTDYYTNQASMVIQNQFLHDYLNGNKKL